MSYELWGPLSDLEKSLCLCGIRSAKLVEVQNPVKTTLGFTKSSSCPVICVEKDELGAGDLEKSDVVFDRAVQRPASAPKPVDNQELDTYLHPDIFAAWAWSCTDDHFINLCLWASNRQANPEVLDFIF